LGKTVQGQRIQASHIEGVLAEALGEPRTTFEAIEIVGSVLGQIKLEEIEEVGVVAVHEPVDALTATDEGPLLTVINVQRDTGRQVGCDHEGGTAAEASAIRIVALAVENWPGVQTTLASDHDGSVHAHLAGVGRGIDSAVDDGAPGNGTGPGRHVKGVPRIALNAGVVLGHGLTVCQRGSVAGVLPEERVACGVTSQAGVCVGTPQTPRIALLHGKSPQHDAEEGERDIFHLYSFSPGNLIQI
jgi:hypothetical protein